MDSVQTQTFSIRGDGGGEAYIDFCDGQLCVSVVIEDKQADFHFDPVTLGMFAHAYKLHCEEWKNLDMRSTFMKRVHLECWQGRFSEHSSNPEKKPNYS